MVEFLERCIFFGYTEKSGGVDRSHLFGGGPLWMEVRLMGPLKAPMPWDIMVFISITTVGFGFSVQRLLSKDPVFPMSSEVTVADASGTVISKAVDLGCLDRLTTRRIHTEEPLLRLRGRLCTPSPISSLTITNTTTGKEGTVFLRDESRAFLTDGVEIQGGKNIIHLQWLDGSSTEPREVVAEVLSR